MFFWQLDTFIFDIKYIHKKNELSKLLIVENQDGKKNTVVSQVCLIS